MNWRASTELHIAVQAGRSPGSPTSHCRACPSWRPRTRPLPHPLTPTTPTHQRCDLEGRGVLLLQHLQHAGAQRAAEGQAEPGLGGGQGWLGWLGGCSPVTWKHERERESAKGCTPGRSRPRHGRVAARGGRGPAMRPLRLPGCASELCGAAAGAPPGIEAHRARKSLVWVRQLWAHCPCLTDVRHSGRLGSAGGVAGWRLCSGGSEPRGAGC